MGRLRDLAPPRHSAGSSPARSRVHSQRHGAESAETVQIKLQDTPGYLAARQYPSVTILDNGTGESFLAANFMIVTPPKLPPDGSQTVRLGTPWSSVRAVPKRAQPSFSHPIPGRDVLSYFAAFQHHRAAQLFSFIATNEPVRGGVLESHGQRTGHGLRYHRGWRSLSGATMAA